MNGTTGSRIERYRSEIRVTLILLGAPLAVTGGWALAAPHNWYFTFPGAGHHWVSVLGPYNEHLTRDFGSLFLGLGLLLVVSAVVLSRPLVQAALGVTLVWSIPHLVFHMSHLEELPTGDNIANSASLGLTVIVPVVLLVLTLRPDPQTEKTKPTVPAGQPVGTR